MESEDPYHLQRFVAAQDAGGTYDHAAAELRAGRKTSHWMWFIFPQIAGLGYSPASQMYAITSLEEARAYLAHPVLGARLIDCATILTGLGARRLRSGGGGARLATTGTFIVGFVIVIYTIAVWAMTTKPS